MEWVSAGEGDLKTLTPSEKRTSEHKFMFQVFFFLSIEN